MGELIGKESFWQQSCVDFIQEYSNYGFKYSDSKRRSATSQKSNLVSYKNIPSMETRCYFAKGAMSKVEMFLFNKGDAKNPNSFSKDELMKLVATVSEKITPEGKNIPKEKYRMSEINHSKAYVYTRKWTDIKPSATLMWGFSGPRGSEKVEFLRLSFSNEETSISESERKQGSSAKATKSSVLSNKKTNSEGDVWVANVPMVDQGQKGYCAVAVAERVLRYYGNDIDEHQIAQMAGSSADGGTDVGKMITAIEAIGKKCRLGLAHVARSNFSLGKLEKQIATYNQVAKKEGKKPLNISNYIVKSGSLITYYPTKIYEDMDPKIVKLMALKDGSGYKRFSKGVRQQINAGIPLFWGVTLGIFKEPELHQQTFGGHMRLIIGYNDETKEIIYTDSWGVGHELKRMPEDWAWAITKNVFYLKPPKK